MKIITDNKALKAFCDSVTESGYITVDTEFLREKTYFPKLCLIQIAGALDAAIIDPLAEGIDLAPVFALLADKNLTKVFHAARQDIEIFYMLSGKMPTPIFDTQVAAAVCGYGESVGYEALVNQIVGAEIDKSSRFTDWSARPLTEKQLAYALSDVTHLRTIYDDLKIKIEAMGRETWINEEHASLTDPKIYEMNPDDAWMRLKLGNLRPKNLAALRELARWREIEARETNVPRGRIIKDEVLIELAHILPRKEADLARIRSIGSGMGKTKVATILSSIEKVLAMPASDYPQLKKHPRRSENIVSALAMLQLLLKISADQHKIAAPMIAHKDDLEAIALGSDETPALSGWRFDIFGRQAQLLMQGKLKLSLGGKGSRVVLEESE